VGYLNVSRYVEFHLGRIITLSALSELLTEIAIERFGGFVRIREAGEGGFVACFPRADGDVALFSLIRERPSELYAERSSAYIGDWVLAVYASEITSRTGALAATEKHPSLHALAPLVMPTFADWLLGAAEPGDSARELFARYAPAVPVQLRGVID
jgi:hypothetical protein